MDDQEWLDQLEHRIRDIEAQQRVYERYEKLLHRLEQLERRFAPIDHHHLHSLKQKEDAASRTGEEVGIGMAARLGGALYWAGWIGAALMVLIGLTAMNDYHDFGLFIFFAILASASWSIGRGLRYILSRSSA